MDTLLQYGLVAVLLALLLTPFGLPVPEEISLLVAGGLTGLGHADPLHALAVGYIGVVGSDLICWIMGRRVGLHPTGFISKLVGPEQIEEIADFYKRWGNLAIVIARQFPGLRFPAFFFAGASGVPLGRFMALDCAAACITVGVFTGLGHAFADDLGRLVPWIDRFRAGGSAVLLVVVGLVIWRIVRRRRRRRERGK